MEKQIKIKNNKFAVKKAIKVLKEERQATGLAGIAFWRQNFCIFSNAQVCSRCERMENACTYVHTYACMSAEVHRYAKY